MDIQAYFGRAWVPWSVVASSLFVYALMTLTLRTNEPENLAERLGLTHSELPDAALKQEVLEYRLMRLVLEGVRIASVAALSMGSVVVVRASFGELSPWPLLVAGALTILVLVLVRVALSQLLAHCYTYVVLWVDGVAWLARKSGGLFGPFRRSVTDLFFQRNGTVPSKTYASNVLTVARNLSSDDVRASDLIDPVANVAVVEPDQELRDVYDVLARTDGEYVVASGGNVDNALGTMNLIDARRALVEELGRAGSSTIVAVVEPARELREVYDLLTLTDGEYVVVSGGKVDNVLGTVHLIDARRALVEELGRAVSLESVMRPVVKLTSTQQLGAVVDSFRGHEDKVGIVRGEGGTFLGTLTYYQVVRRLFANGEATAQDDGVAASGVGTGGVVETQESVG